MLLKPDKLPSLTASCRPSNLISSIMKLFERVIEQRLRSHLEKIEFSNSHTPPTNKLTKPACHHNSFRGSRCDSNHATTISPKPRTLSLRFRQFFLAYDKFFIKAQFITTGDHPRYFESFRQYFLPNHRISANPYQTNLSRLPTPKYQKQIKPSRCF